MRYVPIATILIDMTCKSSINPKKVENKSDLICCPKFFVLFVPALHWKMIIKCVFNNQIVKFTMVHNCFSKVNRGQGRI